MDMETIARATFFIGLGLAAGLLGTLRPSNRFRHAKMKAYALKAIADFAETHRDETFYGFSIDATMLCLNSDEAFQRTIAEYRARGICLSSTQELEELRLNTGDWEYQGFGDLLQSDGFDQKAYEYHYALTAERQKSSPYAKAMDRLIEDLIEADAFRALRRTSSFFVTRVEHGY